MKKIALLFLSLIILTTVIGCGGGGKKKSNSTTASQSTQHFDYAMKTLTNVALTTEQTDFSVKEATPGNWNGPDKDGWYSTTDQKLQREYFIKYISNNNTIQLKLIDKEQSPVIGTYLLTFTNTPITTGSLEITSDGTNTTAPSIVKSTVSFNNFSQKPPYQGTFNGSLYMETYGIPVMDEENYIALEVTHVNDTTAQVKGLTKNYLTGEKNIDKKVTYK